jgi:hypothetical protein
MPSKDEIVSRLRQIGELKTGDVMPEGLGNSDWGKGMSALCRDAANLIVSLDIKLDNSKGYKYD